MKNIFAGSGRMHALAMLFIIMIIFGLRLPHSTEVVIDWDESVYFTMASDVAGGGTLYQSFWEHKGPLLYFLFVPVIKIFGHSIFILRIFTTLCLLLSVIFIYFISREVFTGSLIFIPPLIYGIFFQRYGGLSSNAEVFMMLPAIIATYCFVRFDKYQKNALALLFLCGVFSASAFFIKSTVFFTIVILPAALLFKKIRERQYIASLFFKHIGAYLCGFFLLALGVLNYFVIHRTLADFFWTYFVFNLKYVSATPLSWAIPAFFLYMADVFRRDAFSVLVLVGTLLIIFMRRLGEGTKRNFVFLFCLLILSFIGFFSARSMYPHYYLQMGLPYCFLTALIIGAFEIDKKVYFGRLLCAVLCLLLIYAYRPHAMQHFYSSYQNQKNADEYRIAEFIKQTTSLDEPIFVLGGQPIIYFLAERKAPIRFFFWLYHQGKWNRVLKLQNSTLALFSKDKPRYFAYRKHSLDVPYLRKFMTDNYHFKQAFGSYTLYEVNASEQ